MADVNDEYLSNWVNTKLRRWCEKQRDLLHEAEDIQTEWDTEYQARAGTNSADDTILDGAFAQTGKLQITTQNANVIMNQWVDPTVARDTGSNKSHLLAACYHSIGE